MPQPPGGGGGRSLPLKPIVNVAMGKEVCKGIAKKVLMFDGRGEGGVAWEGVKGVHVSFTPFAVSMRPVCPCGWIDMEDPLFILYTLGLMGRPKG
jgi:hypothetical protein